MVTRRHWLQATAALAAAPVLAQEDQTGGDPLGSMQYPSLREETIGKASAKFTDAVVVKGPDFADDAMNVPLMVDARGLSGTGGGVARIRVSVDRNPVRQVLEYEPMRALPMLSFRIRMEQASPVRAFVQTQDGQWHVGSTWVQASGGGCTVPGLTRADGSWSRTLGQVQARFFNNVIEGSRRLRVRVMHPMDTGLVAGVPSFHIEALRLEDSNGQLWCRLQLHEPVSENPLLTLELPNPLPERLRLVGRDNNGNPIDTELKT
ncbi:MAG: quinoprotein dehydrogenase-associated SoxYZ-like carrier [Hydrogenophaga sp.]|nr:quinoprotein dehydrogenase-associated SoxYZ-like carrier [Hydrogenophaga sp.]